MGDGVALKGQGLFLQYYSKRIEKKCDRNLRFRLKSRSLCNMHIGEVKKRQWIPNEVSNRLTFHKKCKISISQSFPCLY